MNHRKARNKDREVHRKEGIDLDLSEVLFDLDSMGRSAGHPPTAFLLYQVFTPSDSWLLRLFFFEGGEVVIGQLRWTLQVKEKLHVSDFLIRSPGGVCSMNADISLRHGDFGNWLFWGLFPRVLNSQPDKACSEHVPLVPCGHMDTKSLPWSRDSHQNPLPSLSGICWLPELGTRNICICKLPSQGGRAC